MSVDLRTSFGALVDASYDKMVTNDMGDRTHPRIALGASGNTANKKLFISYEHGHMDIHINNK